MNRIFVLSTLLGVCAISFASLPANNRYGAPHRGNSLGYRGGPSGPGRYPAAPHSPRAPLSHYGAPGAPSAPSAPRSPSYGVPPSGHYGGGRHHGGGSAGLNQYNGPSGYGGPYGGQAHASGLSHLSSPRRSVYQPQQSQQSNARSGSGYPQHYSQTQQSAESRATTHGREMKYTIKDPNNRGTTHVTETHVVSNRQMHGAEAEAAMKKLMGSMGPSSNSGGFDDFFKGMGLPFY